MLLGQEPCETHHPGSPRHKHLHPDDQPRDAEDPSQRDIRETGRELCADVSAQKEAGTNE